MRVTTLANLAGFPFNWDPQRVGTHPQGNAGIAQFGVSIQLGSPASGDVEVRFPNETDLIRVSIQLGSPASGDHVDTLDRLSLHTVSIQLGSPASGDVPALCLELSQTQSFHSIGIPSEWGRTDAITVKAEMPVWFPFNWDPQRVGTSLEPVLLHPLH